MRFTIDTIVEPGITIVMLGLDIRDIEFMIDTTKEVQIVYNNLDWLITARKHKVKQK